jgi:hypothetical protein
MHNKVDKFIKQKTVYYMKISSNSVHTLLAVVFGKILCKVGWHNFTCKMQDCIEEFGHVPNDGRMPKVAKCSSCGVNYR